MNAPTPRDERIDSIAEQFARDKHGNWIDHLTDDQCRRHLQQIGAAYALGHSWSDFGLYARTVIAAAIDEAACEQVAYEEHEGEEA